MNAQDVCLLLGVIGGSTLLSSWIGHRTGDAARDVALMFATGLTFAVASGVLYVAGGWPA